MPSDAPLTGKRLVEAGARAIFTLTEGSLPSDLSAEDIARAALRAQAEAAGVDAMTLHYAAVILSDGPTSSLRKTGAFLRALAEVLDRE